MTYTKECVGFLYLRFTPGCYDLHWGMCWFLVSQVYARVLWLTLRNVFVSCISGLRQGVMTYTEECVGFLYLRFTSGCYDLHWGMCWFLVSQVYARVLWLTLRNVLVSCISGLRQGVMTYTEECVGFLYLRFTPGCYYLHWGMCWFLVSQVYPRVLWLTLRNVLVSCISGLHQGVMTYTEECWFLVSQVYARVLWLTLRNVLVSCISGLPQGVMTYTEECVGFLYLRFTPGCYDLHWGMCWFLVSQVYDRVLWLTLRNVLVSCISGLRQGVMTYTEECVGFLYLRFTPGCYDLHWGMCWFLVSQVYARVLWLTLRNVLVSCISGLRKGVITYTEECVGFLYLRFTPGCYDLHWGMCWFLVSPVYVRVLWLPLRNVLVSCISGLARVLLLTLRNVLVSCISGLRQGVMTYTEECAGFLYLRFTPGCYDLHWGMCWFLVVLA